MQSCKSISEQILRVCLEGALEGNSAGILEKKILENSRNNPQGIS